MGSLVLEVSRLLNSDKQDKYLNDKNRFKAERLGMVFNSKNNISSGFNNIFRSGKSQNLVQKRAFELLPFYE